jgi:Type II transport protein GspH
VELLLVVATSAVVAGAAVPQLMAGLERSRALGAARYLASRMALARTEAVARSANVALLFTADAATFVIGAYRDGNGNGVRTREIASGVDPALDSPVRFGDLFQQVALFMSDPADGPDPAGSVLMSFSALGTATSRTLYLQSRDGAAYAVRVLGATGRTRVLRFVPATRDWIEVP